MDIASAHAERGHTGRGKAVPPYILRRPCHRLSSSAHQAHSKPAKWYTKMIEAGLYTTKRTYGNESQPNSYSWNPESNEVDNIRMCMYFTTHPCESYGQMSLRKT